MANTYYDKVQEQKGNPVGITQPTVRTNQSELDKRMQADADLLYLTPYVLKDSKGASVPDIINITLNKPAIFAANVISSIGNTRQQVMVESENKQVDTAYIESFLNAAIASADRRLWKRGLPTLNPFADVQFCIRGRHARRVLLRKESGQTVVDITPWDGRYIYYEQGESGLAWAAYETMRARDEVVAEYGERAAAKATNRECAVLDVWDDKINEIWIDGEKVSEQENPYGICPVVFQSVLLGYGPMLLDRNWRKNEGESIFFMIRDIVPELNRLASILQTLNMNQLKAAMQYQNPEGSPQDEPPDRPEMGDVVSTGKGKLELIDFGDARTAASMMYNMMEKAFQEGAYTDIDIGNVQQPFSAVALVTIGENKDMVYMPRLAAKELLNIGTAEMLLKEAEQLGGSIELGIPGHMKTFETSKLKGDYTIGYKYFVKSPKTDVARMSLALQAVNFYPRRFIYEQVLQVEDPDQLMRDWYNEQAELLSPSIRQYRIIRSRLEDAEKNNDPEAAREAAMMAMELGLTLDQIRMGVMPNALPTGKPSKNDSVLPLLGAGDQVGGVKPNKMADQLAKQPKEIAYAS